MVVDTDVFSFVLKNDPIASRFRPYMDGAYLYISFATVAELQFGALNDNWGEIRLNALNRELRKYTVLPSNDDICFLYAKYRLQCKNQPIDDLDYWIGACARFYNFPLLTNNWKHFKKMEDLKLISPGH
jgi:predicted nucleic acid-binding protein